MEEKDGLRIIGQFPGHKGITEIALQIKGGKLNLKSRLPFCSYKYEVPLPDWVQAQEASEICFRNGVFQIRFKR